MREKRYVHANQSVSDSVIRATPAALTSEKGSGALDLPGYLLLPGSSFSNRRMALERELY